MKMKINTLFLTVYQYMIILSTIEKMRVNSKNKIAVINVEGAIMTGEAALWCCWFRYYR